MSNSALFFQYILLKIAERRSEDDNNFKTIKVDSQKLKAIKLGQFDMLENFIGFICFYNKRENLFDKCIVNSRGVTVPSIRSTMRFLSGIVIDLDNAYLLSNALEKMKNIEDSLKKEINMNPDHFIPTNSVDIYVENLYPLNGDIKEIENVQFRTKVASCFWISGKEKASMKKSDLKKCYKSYWGQLEESRLGELVEKYKLLSIRKDRIALQSI